MIKNLGNQLNEAGKIKIGIKGAMITSKNNKEFRPPVKLDHFILTTTEKDTAGDYILDTALMEALKVPDEMEVSSVMLNKDNNIIGIPVRLITTTLKKTSPQNTFPMSMENCLAPGMVKKPLRECLISKKNIPAHLTEVYRVMTMKSTIPASLPEP